MKLAVKATPDGRLYTKVIDSATGEKYLLGYHINKKQRITICLDVSVPTEEICRRIDKSYELAVK